MTDRVHLAGDSFFSSPVFLAAISSLLLAQFIKALINLFRWRDLSLRETLVTFMWKTGGMPSSHSSLAVSIATSIGILDGTNSNVFVLALFFALVVVRDAMGVRHSSGLQARALNALGRRFATRFGEPFTPVKEVMGHNPAQVVVGAVLGFFIAVAFCTL